MANDPEIETRLTDAKAWLTEFFSHLGLQPIFTPEATVLDDEIIYQDILDAEVVE